MLRQVLVEVNVGVAGIVLFQRIGPGIEVRVRDLSTGNGSSLNRTAHLQLKVVVRRHYRFTGDHVLLGEGNAELLWVVHGEIDRSLGHRELQRTGLGIGHLIGIVARADAGLVDLVIAFGQAFLEEEGAVRLRRELGRVGARRLFVGKIVPIFVLAVDLLLDDHLHAVERLAANRVSTHLCNQRVERRTVPAQGGEAFRHGRLIAVLGHEDQRVVHRVVHNTKGAGVGRIAGMYRIEVAAGVCVVDVPGCDALVDRQLLGRVLAACEHIVSVVEQPALTALCLVNDGIRKDEVHGHGAGNLGCEAVGRVGLLHRQRDGIAGEVMSFVAEGEVVNDKRGGNRDRSVSLVVSQDIVVRRIICRVGQNQAVGAALRAGDLIAFRVHDRVQTDRQCGEQRALSSMAFLAQTVRDPDLELSAGQRLVIVIGLAALLVEAVLPLRQADAAQQDY